MTVTMTPTMKKAKATLNSKVCKSEHLVRKVGKMLSNVAIKEGRKEVVPIASGRWSAH